MKPIDNSGNTENSLVALKAWYFAQTKARARSEINIPPRWKSASTSPTAELVSVPEFSERSITLSLL
jgi:hypothetical protein